MTRAELKAAMQLKPIAILGFGTAGRGVRALANRMGISSTCFDELDIEGTRQEFTQADARQHSMVIASPGFKPDHPWLTCAKSAGSEILGELDFGSLFVSNPAYAVTGTNGKTVTGRFIAHTLESLGQRVAFLGNTGLSLCGWLSENIEIEPTVQLILEISSFQASLLRYLSLKGLVWTDFYENHLDYHKNINDYFLSKWHLIDRLSVPLLAMGQTVFEAANSHGCKLPEFAKVVPNRPAAPYEDLPRGTVFERAPLDEDFRLCVALGDMIGIPPVIWHQTAASFNLPRYRLSRIAQIEGVSFYNDAKSSNMASTLAGLSRFESPVLWLGGTDLPVPKMESLAVRLSPKVKTAYLIGPSGGPLAGALRRRGVQSFCFETIEEAFTHICVDMESGDNVVFSPGFPPSGRLDSFAQRGNFFEKIVLELQNSRRERTKV